MNPASFTSLVDMLRARADTHGPRLACTFLKDGEEPEAEWTYAELDRRARRVAAALQRVGADGDRALLLFAPGLDFVAGFFGCLYAKRIAVPTPPPSVSRLAQALPRLRAIVESARPRTLVTTASIAPLAAALSAAEPALAGMQVIAADALAEDEDGWRDPGIGRDQLAFLQYTSGSTAVPKGVMVSHGNLLQNALTIGEVYRSSAETTMVSWLPVYHDMGLIGCVLHTLLHGAATYLMSPMAFLKRPLRWLRAVSRFRAVQSGGPNFAYDLCVQRSTPEQRATLDLSSWELAFNGAEPVRARTITEFTRTFEPFGFRPRTLSPCYGLAESTLLVSGATREQPPAVVNFDAVELAGRRAQVVTDPLKSRRALVGCGRPTRDQRVVIVDPQRSTPCAEGEIGEIWIAGPSVAQGYWDQPEETARTFGATLDGVGEERFLRTGDLGFVFAGELYIAGRLKDLIIVDGRNHYPQDLELTVEQSHPAIRSGCSAAFSIDADGAERVVVVAEADMARGDGTSDSLRPLELIQAARRAVTLHHDIDLFELLLVKPGTIPKTTSGKIRRSACRDGYLGETLERWAPATVRAATAAPPA